MRTFYYQQLSSGEKWVYQQMAKAMGERKRLLRLPYLPVQEKRLREISLFVTLDNPDFYWTKGSFLLRREGNGAVLQFPLLISEKEIPSANAAVMSTVSELTENLPAEPAAAAEEICRRLIDWAEYDLSADPLEDRRNQSLWSVFVRRKSLCMGFSKALCLILRLLGMDCIIVLGSVFGDHQNGHSWNMVRISGGWYHLDVTMGFACFQPLWERYHPGMEPPAAPVPFTVLHGSHEMNGRFLYERMLPGS